MQSQATQRLGGSLPARNIPVAAGDRSITLEHLPNKSACLVLSNKRGSRMASVILSENEVKYLGRALVELLK